MYEQVSINKYLLKSFGMPLINSYFTIEGSGTPEAAADFGVPQAITENPVEPTSGAEGAIENVEEQGNQSQVNQSPVANTVGGNIFGPEQTPITPGTGGFPF